MKYRLSIAIVIVLSILSFISCDRTIHEYPTPSKSLVILEFNADRTPPPYYKKVVFDEKYNSKVIKLNETPSLPYELGDGYQMRITAEIYDEAGHVVERRVVTQSHNALPPQDTIHVYLPQGKYRVAAFADYIKANEIKDWHYLTSDLTHIGTDLSTYPQNAHLRSCAVGTEDFIIDYTLTPEGYPASAADAHKVIRDRKIPVHMVRPNARYWLRAIDYGDYLLAGSNIEDITVKIIYTQFAAVGYNVPERRPNKFGVNYSVNVKPDIYVSSDHKTVSLALDYIFTSWSEENVVVADFHIYDHGKEISHINGVHIPLLRNHETLLEGYFLTKSFGKDDGIQIDEDFDGEFIIKI